MRKFLAVFIAAWLAVLTLYAAPAPADHQYYFGPIWRAKPPLLNRPQAAFTPGVPTGQWRDRINDGMRQYNQLNQSIQYVPRADWPVNFEPRGSCPGIDKIVTLHRFNLDGGGGLRGFSGYCTYTVDTYFQRHSSFIIFDSSEDWCLGTGDCYDGVGGSGAGADNDLWSVASHEWGHVGSLAHYSPDDPICGNNSAQETMCPIYQPGTERLRSLGSHDINAFNFRY